MRITDTGISGTDASEAPAGSVACRCYAALGKRNQSEKSDITRGDLEVPDDTQAMTQASKEWCHDREHDRLGSADPCRYNGMAAEPPAKLVGSSGLLCSYVSASMSSFILRRLPLMASVIGVAMESSSP